MLACGTANRNLIVLFLTVILKEGVNANGEVELDEEEDDAEFRNVKAEKHSHKSKDEGENQEEDVENQVRNKKSFGSLQTSNKMING